MVAKEKLPCRVSVYHYNRDEGKKQEKQNENEE